MRLSSPSRLSADAPAALTRLLTGDRIRAVVLLTCAILGAAWVPLEDHRAELHRPTLILVSLDGFRWDFLDRGKTPTLSRLASEGVHAERLVPSFPTKTFPNHYTVVTGLFPSRHGVVANNMLDPQTGERFGLSDRDAVADGKWYGGEPIWVTAELQGMRTAPFFWPGSEAEIGGVRPTYSVPYDGDWSPEDRVDQILTWLDLERRRRPGFLSLYFEDVDDAAHEFGPDPSRELDAALGVVDRAIARLLRGLETRSLENKVDLLIISDHGMAGTSADRLIFLDDYVEPGKANVVDWSPVLALWPSPDTSEKVYQRLVNAHPSLAVYRRGEIPARFAFSEHERIAPIVGISAEGWSVTSRSHFENCPQCFDGGTHGYDQHLQSMGALLIGNGPSFKRHTEIGPIENVHLYNVMCEILGLEPAENQGDATRVHELLLPGAD